MQALGNIYFVHESVEDVLIWDFKDMQFVPVTGKEVNSGNIESVVTKEKAKFPQDFFPEVGVILKSSQTYTFYTAILNLGQRKGM